MISVYFDVALILTVVVAALGAASILAVHRRREPRRGFSSIVWACGFGGALGAGTFGIIVNFTINHWYDALVHIPIWFLVTAPLGLPVGLFIGAVAGCFTDRADA